MSDREINIRLFFGVAGGFFGAAAHKDFGMTALLAALIAVSFVLKNDYTLKACLKKFGIAFTICAAALLDLYIVRSGAVLRYAVTFFYMANESVCINGNLVLAKKVDK